MNRVHRTAVPGFALLLAAFLASGAAALAQQPSQAQINAIRQSCRADYQAHCASVPTGGSASLACLQENAPALSAACQRALQAMNGGGAAPGRTAAPAAQQAAPAPAARAPAATGGAATGAAAAPLTPRQQVMVLRQSCAGDYRSYCSGVPMGGGRAIGCLRANAARLSPQCGSALSGAARR